MNFCIIRFFKQLAVDQCGQANRVAGDHLSGGRAIRDCAGAQIGVVVIQGCYGSSGMVQVNHLTHGFREPPDIDRNSLDMIPASPCIHFFAHSRGGTAECDIIVRVDGVIGVGSVMGFTLVSFASCPSRAGEETIPVGIVGPLRLRRLMKVSVNGAILCLESGGFATDRWRSILFVVSRIGENSKSDLPQIAFACHILCRVLCAPQCRQQQTDQNSDDGDDHEQLNQSKCFFFFMGYPFLTLLETFHKITGWNGQSENGIPTLISDCDLAGADSFC